MNHWERAWGLAGRWLPSLRCGTVISNLPRDVRGVTYRFWGVMTGPLMLGVVVYRFQRQEPKP